MELSFDKTHDHSSQHMDVRGHLSSARPWGPRRVVTIHSSVTIQHQETLAWTSDSRHCQLYRLHRIKAGDVPIKGAFHCSMRFSKMGRKMSKSNRHTESCTVETALLWVCCCFLVSGGISYISQASDSSIHSQLCVTPPRGLSEAAASYALCLGSVGRPSPASVRKVDPQQDLKGQWLSGAEIFSTCLLICIRDALRPAWEGPVYLSSMFTPSLCNRELQVLILGGRSSVPDPPGNHRITLLGS